MRGGEVAGVSANEYSCAHGAQLNFGDLTPYLTYAVDISFKNEVTVILLVGISFMIS